MRQLLFTSLITHSTPHHKQSLKDWLTLHVALVSTVSPEIPAEWPCCSRTHMLATPALPLTDARTHWLMHAHTTWFYILMYATEITPYAYYCYARVYWYLCSIHVVYTVFTGVLHMQGLYHIPEHGFTFGFNVNISATTEPHVHVATCGNLFSYFHC